MSSGATLTASAPQALTTPFVQPQSCADQFKTTSFVSSFPWNKYATTTVKVLVSKEVSACLPPGYGQRVAQGSPLQFSPAVCPSAWTAYKPGVSFLPMGTPATATATLSTAFCCSSGFTLSYLSGVPNPGTAIGACFQDIIGQASTPTPTSTQLFPNGLRVHNAWSITWGASDVATLTPPPPALGTCTSPVLSFWVPGETIAPSLLACQSNDGTSHASKSDVRLFLFMVIGLPIICLAILIPCLVVWCRRHRRKARHRAAL